MRIDSINIPENLSKHKGLKPVHMKKLEDVVIIAGKNGSGKTRLINLIRGILKINFSYPPVPTNQLPAGVPDTPENRKIQEEQAFEEAMYRIAMATENDGLLNGPVTGIPSTFVPSLMQVSPNKVAQKVISLVPKEIFLTDSYTLKPSELEGQAGQIFQLGSHHLNSTTLPAIQDITYQYIATRTADAMERFTKKEIEEAIQKYEELNGYVKLFLKTELSYDRKQQAELFGKRIGLAKLSDGQIILLQFCVALLGQRGQLSDLVVFMDEPENHLHPAALVEVIDIIKHNLPNGQLWIATHSIHLLAHFQTKNIWYMEDGNVQFGGGIPQKVLQSLLGDDTEISALRSFLDTPAVLAANEFAFQCLIEPKVVMTGQRDPQNDQIVGILDKTFSRISTPVRVLDFGMGQGRLITYINNSEGFNQIGLPSKLDYYGYDIPSSKYQDQCKAILDSIYKDHSRRFFTQRTTAITTIGKGTLEFVIMCNVLHEIPPADWLSELSAPGALTELIKPDGYLLIIEDQFLAEGEMAHKDGFLVFNNNQLSLLFSAKPTEIVSADFRGDGRLMAHFIPAGIVKQVSAKSRIEALENLVQEATAEIKRIRKVAASNDLKLGKLHAFWTQQLANATLALRDF